MRRAGTVAMVLCAFIATPGRAQELNLLGYQGAAGEIRTLFTSDVVDPYFASKALLEAHRAGMNITNAGTAWVRWALQMQLPDGRFERYCRSATTNWQWSRCAGADADDAMLAVWLQLLATLYPAGNAPEEWQASMRSAMRSLAELYSPQLEVYQISASQPVGLFMDNVEVHAALRSLARFLQRKGDGREARALGASADRLQNNLIKVFWDRSRSEFRVSTQARVARAFYPDDVAQVYPWLDDVQTPHADARRAYLSWMDGHGKAWLELAVDDYPWGLIALTALKFGDDARAACWLERAAPLRYGKRWSVLDEAASQVLRFRLPFVSIPCARITGPMPNGLND